AGAASAGRGRPRHRDRAGHPGRLPRVRLRLRRPGHADHRDLSLRPGRGQGTDPEAASRSPGRALGRQRQRHRRRPAGPQRRTVSSVVRMCITEPISKGRRAVVPARTDVAHGITVIADHASAMVRAAELIEDVPAGTHRLLIAPASNPTLGEMAEHTSSLLGQKSKRPISVPRWVTRSAGVAEHSFFELNRLAPIWYSPCVIAPGELAAEVGTTDWREGVAQML